jgi:hypothetical protein
MFTNTGLLDVMTWAGTLPADLVNTGTVLDRRLVRISSCRTVGSDVEVGIQGYAGHQYQLQHTDGLTEAAWFGIGAPVRGEGLPLMFTHTNGVAGRQRFYRVAAE